MVCRVGFVPLAVVMCIALTGCGDDDCCESGTRDSAIDTSMLDGPPDAPVVVVDAPISSGACNLLAQSGCALGEKCTWLIDALVPQYVGHIGCAPDGVAAVGDPCMFGAAGVTGYDNCAAGTVCSNYRGGTGNCKAICDLQGGSPQCGTTHVCVAYSELFSTATTVAGGVCDVICDPLADNDFDGSGSLTRTGTACGSASIGCYGFPSYGTPPMTAWSCAADINYDVAQPLGLRHRVIAPGPPYHLNSCNQGYLPLLYESSGSTTVICVAMCSPLDCYAGNCGTDDENRFGAAPHRCNDTDARGTFSQAANGEHCQYLWIREIDNGDFLPSAHSDTLGFCFDHSKYLYDSDNDNVPDTVLPACQDLPDGFGSGGSWGAADLGCVDSTRRVAFTGKPPIPKVHHVVSVRPPYQRVIAP